MNPEFTIRRATPDDAALISLYRRLMFTDIGYDKHDNLMAMEAAYAPWVRERLTDDGYMGVLMMAGEAVAACAGMLVVANPPNPVSIHPQRGYILDVYTAPDYRRRGLARQLMAALVEIARERQFSRVDLHASDEGRPLYEAMGFSVTGEMRLWLVER